MSKLAATEAAVAIARSGDPEQARSQLSKALHSFIISNDRRHATSLGGVESTMERRAAIPGQEHLPPSLLRISVGIEDANDLMADLGSAMRASAP